MEPSREQTTLNACYPEPYMALLLPRAMGSVVTYLPELFTTVRIKHTSTLTLALNTRPTGNKCSVTKLNSEEVASNHSYRIRWLNLGIGVFISS